MATENLEYLDESGLNRTAGNVLAKIAESKAQIEEELNSLSYAKPDGIYPEMTVGAVIGADETSQWAQRESTGTGSATVRSVQGAAVAWNQTLEIGNSSDWTGSPTISDGELTKTISSDATWTSVTKRSFDNVLINGHVYYGSFEGKGTVHAIRLGLNTGNSSLNSICLIDAPTTEYKRTSGIVTFEKKQAGNSLIISNSPTHTQDVAGDYFTVRNIMLIDLTTMFGSGNEPSTVAEFERMYPAAYYPYSAPVLKPVQIAGIQSKDSQGGELDAIEWTAQTLRAAGSVADVLYADHVDVNVGAATIAIGEGVTFSASSEPNSAGLYNHTLQYTESAWAASGLDRATYNASYWLLNAVSVLGISNATGASGATTAGFQALDNSRRVYFRWPSLLTQAQFEALVAGAGAETLMFALATPTTQPISPALPMTYRVQQGGSESIIVPSGEISAAPIITIAEPVNMSTELAQIWAAIEALQGSRQALQSDVRNDVQEITADLTPIDVTKEVQQTDENREVSE